MLYFSKYYFNKKKSKFINFFLFLVLFGKIKTDNCLHNSYLDLNYVKTLTLENNYKVMLSKTGIYSYDEDLKDCVYSYDFTDDQKLPENEEVNYISNADLSQFSGEDGETKYVLCIVKQIIYVMTELGEVIFSQDISDTLSSYNAISLVAYKYSNNIYYFTLALTLTYSYNVRTLYYQINFKGEDAKKIKLISKLEERPHYNGGDYWADSETICCKKMYLNYINVLTCFFSFSEIISKIIALSYNPDEEFSTILGSNLFEEPDDKKLLYIKCSTNKEKTKALMCYTIETPKGKCVYYDINENTLSSIFIESSYCSSSNYGINVYYFQKTNEYIFSCVNNENKFFMKRIDSDFNIIEDNDIFNPKEFSGCTDFSTFSIIYISDIQVYSIMLNTICSNNEDFIRVFLLLDETCQIPEINNKPEIETTIVTTLPQIITTIITTMPEVITTVVTTIPVIITIILTTIPDIITTIVTTTPIIETTIIRTTIPENIPETTIIHISTTLPEPEIISTIPNIQPTIITTQIEKDETTEIHTEKLCSEKGKIYSGGKCVCDENNGYYSINSEYARNKCYKKNEMLKMYIMIILLKHIKYVFKHALLV